MARFDIWLETQKSLVNDGAACSKITLEGPDGTTWGTWTIGMANLEQSIEGILGSLRQQLPKGKHAAKLIASSSDGQQLSVMPLTIAGDSSEATEGAQQQLHAQRAQAIMISNFERGYATISKMLEHNAELTVRAIEGNNRLLERLESVEARKSDHVLAVVKEEGKQQRLGKLLEHVEPMLQVAMGLASEYAASWLEKQSEKRELAKTEPKQAKAELPPVPPPSLPAVQEEPTVAESSNDRPEGPATSSQKPIESRDSGSAAQSGEPRPHDEGRPKGDDGRASGGDRRKTQKARGAAKHNRERAHENTRKDR